VERSELSHVPEAEPRGPWAALLPQNHLADPERAPVGRGSVGVGDPPQTKHKQR
jgi:hypothetical protein